MKSPQLNEPTLLLVATVAIIPTGIAIANGNGNHTCEYCHPVNVTLCDTRECGSNEVCTGRHGTLPNGQPWVIAECAKAPNP